MFKKQHPVFYSLLGPERSGYIKVGFSVFFGINLISTPYHSRKADDGNIHHSHQYITVIGFPTVTIWLYMYNITLGSTSLYDF